jgi:predicted PurR-regulated permease PerM
MTFASFVKRASIVILIILVPIIIWLLFDVVLIAIGSVMIATLLWLVAEPFTRWFRFNRNAALALSGAIIIGALGGAAYLFGSKVGGELQDVIVRAEAAQHNILHELKGSPVGELTSQRELSRGVFFVYGC